MKIKLRDMAEKQYEKWIEQNCEIGFCEECVFNFAHCIVCNKSCWIFHKELYSETFLNQEVEFENHF